MTDVPEGDYVLRNSHRTTVLFDIARRIGTTPAAKAITDQRAMLRSEIANIATRMLIALAGPYRDNKPLCADLQAEETTSIRYAGFEHILFGQVIFTTSVWPALVSGLQTDWRSALKLDCVRPEDLPATTPVLDFRKVGATFTPVSSLPIADLKTLTMIEIPSHQPDLARSQDQLLAKLGQIELLSRTLIDLYADLPAVAVTIAHIQSWKQLVQQYPRAIEIKELHPRGAPPPAQFREAANLLSSL